MCASVSFRMFTFLCVFVCVCICVRIPAIEGIAKLLPELLPAVCDLIRYCCCIVRFIEKQKTTFHNLNRT